MKKTFRVEGLKELEKALLELKTATARRLVRKNLMAAAEPMADAARALVPDDPATTGYDLGRSIAVSTKLSRRQRKKARRIVKSGVEVFMGSGPLPHAHLQEFGTVNHAAQPFMRPAWDAHKDGVVDAMREATWADIEMIAKRNARKV